VGINCPRNFDSDIIIDGIPAVPISTTLSLYAHSLIGYRRHQLLSFNVSVLLISLQILPSSVMDSIAIICHRRSIILCNASSMVFQCHKLDNTNYAVSYE